MARTTDTRERARRRELAGHDERALALYEIALRESRASRDAGTDPGLCVRAGDVHARLGETEQALERYREAVDLYVDQGLIPNAITVLERLLGLYPDRLEFRRRMVELQLEIGQLGDARTHLLRYLEALREVGDGDRAEEALRVFGGQFGPDDDLRRRARSLVDDAHERTRREPPEPATDEAGEGSGEIQGKTEQDTEPSGEPRESASPRETLFGRSETARAAEEEEASAPEEVTEPDRTREAPLSGRSPAGDDGVVDLEEVRDQDRSLEELLGRDEPGPSTVESPDRDASDRPEPSGLRDQLGEVEPTGIPGSPPEEEAAEPEEEEAGEEPSGEALAEEIARPEDEQLGVRAELEQGLEILDDLLELAPDRLELHRRKVAYARRLGDAERLKEAYLALAAGLAEASGRGARLLYERVLELDPDNSKALSGLARLDASELEAKKSEGEDAAAGNHPPRMTEAADHQTRQELGEVLWAEFEESVRQLPWLDGATQTFQAAGSEFLPPLAAFEMLGRYLLARNKDERAARVLSLALEVDAYSDEEIVDVLFHLSRAYTRLGREEEARRIRERVAEADEDFASILEMVPGAEGSEAGGNA